MAHPNATSERPASFIVPPASAFPRAPAGARLGGTLWIDVEDLFQYAANGKRPSGIQRLAFEIDRALYEEYGDIGRVRFVRHGSRQGGLEIVSWGAIVALFDRLTRTELSTAATAEQADAPNEALPPLAPQGQARRVVHWLLRRLPTEIREALHRFLRAEAEAARALAAIPGALWRWGVARFPRLHAGRREARPVDHEPGASRPAPAAEATGGIFRRLVAPGDVLLVLGSPWFRADYGAFVEALKRRHDMRVAVLVYDLIPHLHPEWCDPYLVRMFRAWFASVLPLADAIFAISRASADDVEAYAAEVGFPLSRRVQPIPIGTGFGAAHSAAAVPPWPRLPLPCTYALVVSTIEPRKNHMLLFRVWRRLVAEMPRERVPTLVCAGRVGWMVGDLMQQLANAEWLDDKIRLVEDPTDAEIEALYRGCLFTLFPSFAEGWGLPVTESLAFGKPCLIADHAALREAGGTLARYFDPDNLHDAYRTIRATIEDPAGLAAWEAQVQREFRPVPWGESAAAILDDLGLSAASTARPLLA